MKEKIILNAESGISTIIIGDSMRDIHEYLPENDIVIITDSNLFSHYSTLIEKFRTIVINPGEDAKDIETLVHVFEQLISFNADKTTFLVGFGGGVICDLTGFVASVFKRGLKFGFVSTSLLSQIDASIGGKNGINLKNYKNIIGLIRQPEFVLCDQSVLNTLPEKDYLSGFAEIIKYGLIGNTQILNILEENIDRLLNRDKELLRELVFESVSIKVDIVTKDENDSGERRTLNFGHTIGHALEKIYNLRHGEAVSIGIIKALMISEEVAGLDRKVKERVIELFSLFHLPVDMTDVNPEIFTLLSGDKKMSGDNISFILLKKPGEPIIMNMTKEELNEHVKSVFKIIK